MTLPSSGTITIDQIRTEMNTSSGSLRDLSSLAGFSTPDSMSEFYGYSNYYRNNLICYTDPYITAPYYPNITSCTIYSTYGGGTRSAYFYVQYSDDNNNWYNAWAGLMSNYGSCGVVTVTGPATAPHRFWRFYESGAVQGHFPRTSRITFGDTLGRSWTLARYVFDNCDDIGNYQPYIIPYDFSDTIPDLASVTSGTNCKFNGISWNSGGWLYIPGAGGQYGSYGNFTGTPTYGSFQFWFYPFQVNNYRNYFSTNNNQGNTGIRFELYDDGTSNMVVGNGGSYNDFGLGSFSANNWYNIAVTWNLNTKNIKVYKNNSLIVNSYAYYWPEALNAWACGIGYDFGGNRNMYGAFGPLFVYNTELTANQVQQNWITHKARYGY